jgi:signal transduction histidine kinase/ActR/RegA family two-component response regulator
MSMIKSLFQIRELLRAVPAISPEEHVSNLNSLFDRSKTTSLAIIDKDQHPVGFITYRKMAELLSTQFGFALYSRKPVQDVMFTEHISVDANTNITDLAEQVLQRSDDLMYEDLIITDHGCYCGLLPVARVIRAQQNSILRQVQELDLQKQNLARVNAELESTLESLRTTEAQLLHAEKMASLGTVAAGIAHDFNNLLSVITSSTAILRYNMALSPRVTKCIESIEASTERATQFIKQLLQFSQKQAIATSVLSLNRIVEETFTILRHSLPRRINIVTVLAAEQPAIIGNESQLQQVLMNLAVNSRDAIANDGTIALETAMVYTEHDQDASFVIIPKGTYAVLRVSDSGAGIAPDNMKRIFDPFFTTKDVGKGTGLGLSVVFGIVQKHGGFVNVRSEVGKGTTFEFYFPPTEAMEMCFSVTDSSTQTVKGNETLLLVDDDDLVLENHGMFLEELGYTVLRAHSGAEALELYRQQHSTIQLVLMDMLMPEMDGRVAAQKLREIVPDVCVLFISGYSDESLIKAVLEEGAISYISKPFKPNELSRKIQEVFAMQKSELVN